MLVSRPLRRHNAYAPLAQLDRAQDYESWGRPFESARARFEREGVRLGSEWRCAVRGPSPTSLRRIASLEAARGPQILRSRPAQYGSRSFRLYSLPLGSRGICAIKSIVRGHL